MGRVDGIRQVRFEEARLAYVRARDEDVCPLRAITPLVQTVRSVAADAQVRVIDFEQIVDERSEHSLPGHAMFHDHVHPTIQANFQLALAIMRQLEQSGLLPAGATADEHAFEQIFTDTQAEIDRQKYARELRLLTAMLGWLGQNDLAKIQAELSLQLSGRTATALLELANGLKANKAPHLAIDFLEQATELEPTSAVAYLRLGTCCLDAGMNDPGIKALQQALRLDAELVEAHARVGVALAAHGELKAAEEHLASAVRLDANSEVNLNNLGLILAKQGRLQEALENYRRSLELNPRFSSAHFNSALAHEQLGRFADARRHYQQTLLLVPEHEEARARLQATTP